MAVVLSEMKGNARTDGEGPFVVKKENGAPAVNGNGVNGSGSGSGKGSLRVPERVIEEGVRVVRGCLEEVVDIEGDGEGS